MSGFAVPTTTITIEPGNYNANTLITELKAQFTAANITFTNIKIYKASGKLIFTSNIFFSYRFTGTMLDILGTNSNVISVNTVYKCIYPLNLLGVQI